jgi:hypothetical protein
MLELVTNLFPIPCIKNQENPMQPGLFVVHVTIFHLIVAIGCIKFLFVVMVVVVVMVVLDVRCSR